MPSYTDKEVKRQNLIEEAVLVALIIGIIAFMVVWNHYRPVLERAAYNEGFYGVDRDAAMAMAERGIGKTSADVLEGK